jgi:hypothetical protein
MAVHVEALPPPRRAVGAGIGFDCLKYLRRAAKGQRDLRDHLSRRVHTLNPNCM